jgi:hypothetical protein
MSAEEIRATVATILLIIAAKSPTGICHIVIGGGVVLVTFASISIGMQD